MDKRPNGSESLFAAGSPLIDTWEVTEHMTCCVQVKNIMSFYHTEEELHVILCDLWVIIISAVERCAVCSNGKHRVS
jgi:hypothetical protein